MKYHLKKWLKLKFLFFILAVTGSCIDPFNPGTDRFQSMLVVDALVTDEDASYYCYLTRTFKDNQDIPKSVKGATVSVADDTGASFPFREIAPGVYRSDSLTFRGIVGRSCTLHITSAEGEYYVSDPVTMLDVPEVDSLYFGKGRFTTDDGVMHEGIWIYINSEKPADAKYMRWTYEEYWKFRVPWPKIYEYTNQYDIQRIDPQEVENVICWNHHVSDDIIIENKDADPNHSFEKKPMTFIASDLSDRITIRYYIKVSQFAITEEEYIFWDLLKQINEAGGDIFHRQPFQLFSNLHNSETPEDQVLGYFRVAAVRSSSFYIDVDDLQELGLPSYDYGCKWAIVEPEGILTFDDIYDLYTRILKYVFTAPVYNDEMHLIALVFNTPRCADCRVTGNLLKPDFWVDTD